ncbi:MAG: hypothetical protein A2289_26530 [Deltaproteobacteria bacterium RIFOXYA12_FULL_58_15]|nr:MAG: hypothetical protein A2289_26530 [Deltaproteobacteria bacterium RIFOXYA12_FULL_58_15]OGR07709.1 MAG: hypothetical protein A2341_06715 [Deltaproteobacteria bacterium RIFOXYB12_FULL_58_9]
MPKSVETARLAFSRLSQQEQLMILGGIGAFVLLILLGLGWGVSGAISKAENRVKVLSGQLNEVIQLQGEYRVRAADKEKRMRELSKSRVLLVSEVEKMATTAGVEIGQLKPEESDPSAEGIVESRVDLRASNLSPDRLQEFLNLLEKAAGVVVVRRLKVSRPYRRDTLDVELTVTAYKRKES